MTKPKKISVEDLFIPDGRFHILRILTSEPSIKLNLFELLARLDLDYEKMRKHLDFFVEGGILQEIEVHDDKYYQLDVGDLRAQAIRLLFNLWNLNTEQYPKEKLDEIVQLQIIICQEN